MGIVHCVISAFCMSFGDCGLPQSKETILKLTDQYEVPFSLTQSARNFFLAPGDNNVNTGQFSTLLSKRFFLFQSKLENKN